jgi:hypothetical protein
MLHLRGGKAEPTAADAKGNLLRAYLNDGVLRAVQSMGGCVAAKQGSP